MTAMLLADVLVIAGGGAFANAFAFLSAKILYYEHQRHPAMISTSTCVGVLHVAGRPSIRSVAMQKRREVWSL